ncbi:MAG: hypothetical protein LKI41_04855, partial [Bifidobacterium psychraerophilum]|nr:hypothetical protein [Bifidobacterium psychraerophilum]
DAVGSSSWAIIVEDIVDTPSNVLLGHRNTYSISSQALLPSESQPNTASLSLWSVLHLLFRADCVEWVLFPTSEVACER